VQIAGVILAFALLALVLFVISAPLRADPTKAGREASQSSNERAELEAAREAKYREIRDAELDMRTGKLSRADFESIDGSLRAEALQILDRLQALDTAAERDVGTGREV
jgi:parvulin-like peptidyl-prolyl isomerase